MSDYTTSQDAAAQFKKRQEDEPMFRTGEPTQSPLGDWWLRTAQEDLQRTVPKMEEYGSYDLVMIGDVLCELMGWADADDAIKAEVGCWFYLLGKVARAVEAMKLHQLPGADTPFDVSVYALMVRRIRDAGLWG